LIALAARFLQSPPAPIFRGFVYAALKLAALKLLEANEKKLLSFQSMESI
jgi:hypothetical protein